jgi:hypothetical protein
MGGPIIAASQPTIAAPEHEGPIGYGFSPPVTPVPGQVYALEPVSLTRYLLPWYSIDSSYPGKYFARGTEGNYEVVGRDLVFRVGLGLDIVPEPSPASVLLIAAGFFVAYRFAKRCSLFEAP